MDKKSIILIGMPGCGKSTVGVLLAKAVCKRFLDTDLLIQQREKKPLQVIINTRGNLFFADCEEQAILAIRQRGQVIATERRAESDAWWERVVGVVSNT